MTLRDFQILNMAISLDGHNKVYSCPINVSMNRFHLKLNLINMCPLGILLLNAGLTVRANQANSHKDKVLYFNRKYFMVF